MSAEDSIGNPYPPPPPGWEPAHLTADIEAALRIATHERIQRIARARGITIRQAAVLVHAELRGSL